MKKPVLRKVKTAPIQKAPVDKSPFPDFMKKEIYTQSLLAQNILMRYINADKINFDFLKLNFDRTKRIYITADGALFGCAVSAGCNFEVLTDLPCVSILLSEFNCANPILDKNTLVIILAESEADSNISLAKKRCDSSGAKTVIILDNAKAQDKNSRIISLDYESMALFPTASYTAKYLVLCLLALYLGEKNKIVTELYVNIATKMLLSLCSKIKNVNETDYFINSIAGQISGRDIILTGRNVDFSSAVYGETALNFLAGEKARAVPSGELRYYKNSDAVLIAFISNRELMRLTLADIDSYKENAIVVAPNALTESIEDCPTVITYTDSIPLLNPIISSAAVQLLFYNMAKNKNLPTDKNENPSL